MHAEVFAFVTICDGMGGGGHFAVLRRTQKRAFGQRRKDHRTGHAIGRVRHTVIHSRGVTIGFDHHGGGLAVIGNDEVLIKRRGQDAFAQFLRIAATGQHVAHQLFQIHTTVFMFDERDVVGREDLRHVGHAIGQLTVHFREFGQELGGKHVLGFHRNDEAVVLAEFTTHFVIGFKGGVAFMHESFDAAILLQGGQLGRHEGENGSEQHDDRLDPVRVHRLKKSRHQAFDMGKRVHGTGS